jgi:hypothetical protein
MNLEEFIQESKNDIERFEKFWKEQQALTPEHFPPSMPPGDWFDQFMQFISTPS